MVQASKAAPDRMSKELVLKALSPLTPALVEVFSNVMDLATQGERARIVAWLRGPGGDESDYPLVAIHLADAIERGEHLPKSKES